MSTDIMTLVDAVAPITAIEFFAGGGGFSHAFRQAATGLGRKGKLLLAVNHDPEAIRTHRKNFPGTNHCLAPVESLVMEDLMDADMLFGSPECRRQAAASGKPLKHQVRASQRRLPGCWTDGDAMSEAERSRATMWQMYRAAYAKQRSGRPFKIVLIENVIEAAMLWGHHADWVEGFEALGYRYRGLFLNARHFGVPQSRDRYFACFTLQELPVPDLDFYPQAPCHRCKTPVGAVQCWKPMKSQGSYGEQYDYRCPFCNSLVIPFYRPAATFLNFADRGERIGAKKRGLCKNTCERIEEGLQRFCQAGQPIPASAYDLPPDLPTPLPFLVKYNKDASPLSVFEPLSTVASRDRCGLVFLPPSWREGTIPRLSDCWFRMLSPQEVQAAMCMQDLTIVSPTKKEMVKQCGLAVPPPLATAIMQRLFRVLPNCVEAGGEQ